MNHSDSGDDVILRTEGVSKTFGSVQALDTVSFVCQKGEVHGLVGENGAGKTTLMKILAGEFQPDQGDIFLRDERVEFRNPRQSKEKGISLIHQELSLVPYLNVAENLFLGKEPRTRFGFIDSETLYEKTAEALGQLEIELDLDTPVVRLTIAQKQLLEIAKSLQENPQILIMDEPTAALERQEIDILFTLIRRIKGQGQTVIFISHRLEEVSEITDKITVLRNGKAVLSTDSDKISKDELIEAIIGRRLEKFFPPKAEKIGKEFLTVTNLSRGEKIQRVNLTVREGEILGIAGLEGQGQHMLLRTLFGADLSPDDRGEITLKGRTIRTAHPRHAVRMGFGYVPGDRRTEGLVMNLSVRENVSLPGLYKRARGGFINGEAELRIVEETTRALRIKISSQNSQVQYLSGGNQQKVVLAKWLAADADIFILDEPTRGVDIGTRAEIYNILRDLANRGKAIIISSRDLDEVLGLSDRIAIIHKGRIVDEFEAAGVSKERILGIITGVVRKEEGQQPG
jgi:ABC-type sugar transport system ATPase subunit